MELCKARQYLREKLARFESRSTSALTACSFLALALVGANELITQGSTIPLLGCAWSNVHIWLRTIIWLLYVGYFGVFALASKNPLSFAREHLLELVICVCWLPYSGDGFLRHLTQIKVLDGILSLEALQLIGTIAHGWRAMRATAHRFNQHPLFVTGSAALVVVCSAAGLLTRFEPQTFKTFWDAAWYALVTITTIGYGDLVPHTPIGRVIGAVLMVSGISLVAVFISLMSEIMHRRLLKKDPAKRDAALYEARGELTRNNELLAALIEEQKATRELLAKLLEEQQKAHAQRSGTSPEPPDPENKQGD